MATPTSGSGNLVDEFEEAFQVIIVFYENNQELPLVSFSIVRLTNNYSFFFV